MRARVEIDEDLVAAARAVASRRGQSLSAFVEQALREARAPSPEGLTVRELQILRLMALGLTDRQIAARLGLSVERAKTSRMKIYRKLNVHSRGEAVSFAVAEGMVSRPGPSPRLHGPTDLPTYRGQGLRAGVNLDDSAALLELMESSHDSV
jgi:DNA-binding CsgD family transcriptional regulator